MEQNTLVGEMQLKEQKTLFSCSCYAEAYEKCIGRDSSEGRARPLHGRGHGIDARS